MPSGQAVYIKSGELTRQFAFSPFYVNPPTYSVVAALASQPIYKESPFSTFQAIAKGTGAITATIAFQSTNDDNTGRGFILGGRASTDAVIGTTNTSTTITAPGDFIQLLVGAVVVAENVPLGTTVVSVAADGRSAVLSAAATATKPNAQARFFDTMWNATALGTVSLTTGNTADGFTTTAPWRYMRAVVSNLTGTITGVFANMGV